MKSKWNLNTFAWANEEKLPGFGRLLSSWLDVHRTFCEGAQPYFSWEWGHNERAQIGLLANAATLIGGLSIEEGRAVKQSELGEQEEGRGDLWLRLCPPTPDNDYVIEAKIEQYLNVENLGKALNKIAKKSKAVSIDAERLKGQQGKKVAITFLSLRFQNEDLSSLELKTNDLVSHIRNQSQSEKDLDAIGVIWMGANDFQRSKDERKVICPTWINVHFGMVLLASRINI